MKSSPDRCFGHNRTPRGKCEFSRHRHWLNTLALLAGLIGAFVSVTVPARAAPKCEVGLPLVFADLDWDSARLHTAIASYIVQQGYGCEVEYAPGGTLDAFSGLSTGAVDVMMEVWKDNFFEKWDAMEEKGFVLDVGVNFSDAVQGWFVPRYLVEGDAKRGIKALAPDLRSVSDLRRYKHLFAEPSNPETGIFTNCVPSWSCASVNTKKLKAYGLAEHFTDRRSKTGDELADYITTRYEAGKPFLAYYWEPTWILGAFDLIRLEEPPYDEEVWQNLLIAESPERATAYPPATVNKGLNFFIEIDAPVLFAFFTRYGIPTRMIDVLLSFRHKNNLSIDQTARHFLVTHPELWKQWVSNNAARQIDDSILRTGKGATP